MATIEVFTGPMFAGKTTGLIDRMVFFAGAGVKTLLIKHASDTRYAGTAVVTHAGVALEARPATDVDALHNLVASHPEVRVVGVDEAQFFNHGIVAWARDLRMRGVTVVLAGLDRESNGNYFGPMPWLLAHADVVHKLSAECECGLKAYQTRRKTSAPSGMVGGAERYEVLCWTCWFRKQGEVY